MTCRPGVLAAAALAAVLLGGCSESTADRPQLTVYAAASLTTSFTELVDAFAAEHPQVEVLAPVFDGSSALAAQLIEGAPADVFASADLGTMRTVQDAGLLAGQPKVFASNTLQIAVAPGNPLRISGLADLADPAIDVVLCAAEVPCGAAADTLISAAGIRISAASEEQNVAAVATKVRLGEADAGLVYATDIRQARGELGSVPIPDADLAVNRYAIGILRPAAGTSADEFVDWVVSPKGQAILTAHGFGQP